MTIASELVKILFKRDYGKWRNKNRKKQFVRTPEYWMKEGIEFQIIYDEWKCGQFFDPLHDSQRTCKLNYGYMRRTRRLPVRDLPG